VRFELLDYQADAVAQVLDRLDKARRMLDLGLTGSVALTAPTGAGKTVMAAAVIESLLFGNADLDIAPDPGAVVLWFTSDPSLNEQTRHRIMQASDRIGSGRLRVVESTFAEQRLRPGNVYFLNSQKLGRNSLLVRGAGAGEPEQMLAAADLRARTFWEVLAATIADEGTTLYVFLDEAHVGMNTSKRDLGEKSTIVRQLVNGEAGAPPVPIVLGISATVDRFKAAMEAASDRTTLPDVTVDATRVQESGLLKDDILLSFPAEVGGFDTVLLRHAVARTRESSQRWSAYHASQGGAGDPVQPLLVVQVPNTPSTELLADAVRTILDEWPELGMESIAHVFGERTALAIGGHEIAYIAPEDVAERRHVRVLLAKDAISTGWDCPRAEVLVSFRPAQDVTHITQLLGRMVRTPLARRIPGDDRLNSVECVLPFFDRAAAEQVARRIMGEGGEPIGPRVSFTTADFVPNPAVPAAVWDVFDALPSQTIPRRGARPVGRFTALGAALARDGLVPDGHRRAIGELVAFLRGQAVEHDALLAAEVEGLLEVSGETLRIGPGIGGQVIAGSTTFALRADDHAIEADFRVARRVLSPQLATAYADVLEEAYQDGYFEAHLRTAALARVPGVAEALDARAERLFQCWDAEHRVAIKGLPDERRVVYQNLRALAGEPRLADLRRPDVRTEPVEDAAGARLPTCPRHLLADEAGLFPIGRLNEWERAVLESEIQRCVAWYRNPARASADALAIAYRDGQGEWRRMCPDFVFFGMVDGEIRPSIVDPHSPHLGDALPKLRGLTAYAEQHGDCFHRIEAIAVTAAGIRVLDLTEQRVRDAVRAAEDALALYDSPVACDY
jgi:type III restriction enzyme